jgi:pentatricopeptide repeat protein
LSPNAVSYGTIIDGLCKIGRVDDTVSQFNHMISEGLTPDTVVLNALINDLC